MRFYINLEGILQTMTDDQKTPLARFRTGAGEKKRENFDLAAEADFVCGQKPPAIFLINVRTSFCVSPSMVFSSLESVERMDRP